MSNLRNQKRKVERDPNRLWLDKGDWYLEIKGGRYEKVHNGEQIGRFCGPEVLLDTALLTYGERTMEGIIVKAPAIPWLELTRHIIQDPSFLFRFARKSRKLEEFVAGAYSRAGWDRVILTPQNRTVFVSAAAALPRFSSRWRTHNISRTSLVAAWRWSTSWACWLRETQRKSCCRATPGWKKRTVPVVGEQLDEELRGRRGSGRGGLFGRRPLQRSV